MTEAEREAQIRERAAKNPTAGLDEDRFLFRLLDEARAEIARLQAPPGASAVERATKTLRELIPLTLVNGSELSLSAQQEAEIGPQSVALVARALEAAEAAARAQALAEKSDGE